jgi:hypothetical protein
MRWRRRLLMRSITSGDRLAQQFGLRAAIVQGRTFVLEAITPFAASERANACGFTGDLRSFGPLRIGSTPDAPSDHACCWVRCCAPRLTDTVCPKTEEETGPRRPP